MKKTIRCLALARKWPGLGASGPPPFAAAAIESRRWSPRPPAAAKAEARRSRSRRFIGSVAMSWGSVTRPSIHVKELARRDQGPRQGRPGLALSPVVDHALVGQS